MAKHMMDTPRREAICAWLTANGINPNSVPQDSDLTITIQNNVRVIAYEMFHLDPDGHRQLDERGQNVAVTRHTAPLLIEPPEWWEPYEKPTRDELLATVKRVQELAERWRQVSDRQGGPRQELVAALGKHAEL